MTRTAELADRLRRLAKRREDEGIYTDANLCGDAAATIESLSAQCAQPQAGEPVADEREWCKLYHSRWPTEDLLKAREPGGLITDDGEAWKYHYTHSDAQGGPYDLVYRPVASAQPANPTQVPDAVTNAARNLHASLDPENDLKTPEQFNAWSALDLALTSALASNKPVGDGPWVTVRVEDTCDGLLIHPDDAKRWNLEDDRHYPGHFLPDGRYRISLTAFGEPGR